MSDTYTPGPWRVERNHNGRAFGVSGATARYDTDLVCDLHGNPNRDRDAELIAAAPRLLEACKLMMRQVSEGQVQVFEDLDDGSVSAFDMLEKIIVELEGKCP